MPTPIVRSVQFPDETKSTTRPVAIDGYALGAGVTAQVFRDRRWVRCVVLRVEFSVVMVEPHAA